MNDTRRSEQRPFLRRAVFLLAFAASACSLFRSGGSPAPTFRFPIDFAIENKSSEDLTIYVRHDGRNERLDRVSAARTTHLTIPAHMIGMLGDIILIGERPAFGGRIASQSVTVHACEKLEWTIEATLGHSVLAVLPADNCKDR
jgi:hypothetical protein